ncbi:hypothetical protein FNF29_00773 [Cafeteria roenbergensis]|uniref:GB1/RHD3-type G domain-containing protein n=1 Tax=Cafeteria roenbergensis TaxID=33653 RepID=A0A5A8CU34_CAFRO|nr:hypothetical protein FNF29_00773 [Cafeteria roenbergensis]|eukprot:KAA0156662.1 hypothetical protein FNF29_00773 [Cafeteria roenbergensis]
MASASAPGGRPLPFIMPQKDGDGFRIGDEAMSVLDAITVPVVPIAVCGKARTGKSYLMNSFLRRAPAIAAELAGEGAAAPERAPAPGSFTVGSTVESCTQGIWMYSEPVMAKLPDGTDVAVLVLDTEGFGSTDREESYDARVFALATLLSAVLVYNSSGVVNNDAIASLSFVANMSRHIQTSSDGAAGPAASGGNPGEGAASSADDLASLFPSFVWVLRDFHLLLVDSDGQELTPRDYMEQRLADDGALDGDSLRRNRVRRAITTFFRRRDCHALMLPVEDEDDLQRLPELGDDELRRGFLEGHDELVRKLLSGPIMAAKTLHGTRVTGRMLGGLARSYVAAVNDGGVPSVGSAWGAVTQEECRRALDDGRAALRRALDAALATVPLSDEREQSACEGLLASAKAAFEARAVGGKDAAEAPLAELKGEVGKAASRLREANAEAAGSHCRALLSSLRRDHVDPVLRAMRDAAEEAAAGGRRGEGGAAPAAALPPPLGRAESDAFAAAYAERSRGPAAVVWAEAAAFWRGLAVEAAAVAASTRESIAEAERAELRRQAEAGQAAARRAEEEVVAVRAAREEAEAARDKAQAAAVTAKAEAEARAAGATAARRETAAARDAAEDAEARAAAAEKAVFQERARRQAAAAAADEANAAREAAETALRAAESRPAAERAGAGPGAGPAAARPGHDALSPSGKAASGGPDALAKPPLQRPGAPRFGAPSDAEAISSGQQAGGCCAVM